MGKKGAWSREEDHLLRSYIEQYGEGKWYKVPQQAGLDRCRKSCRMRWLNYLKPNIKRGDFEEDEVDLMIRLRKLLGNRQVLQIKWSLIAGRLPGRTSNDVKNYWTARRNRNTDINVGKDKQPPETIKTTVIRPRPRRFTKNLHCLNAKAATSEPIQQIINNSVPMENGILIDGWLKNLLDEDDNRSLLPTSPPIENRIDAWWESLLEEDGFTNFFVEDTP